MFLNLAASLWPTGGSVSNAPEVPAVIATTTAAPHN